MPMNPSLDDKYFVDPHVYNCPFCNRRHVAYTVVDKAKFNWTEGKPCYVYFVQCDSCQNTSMHLSYEDIAVQQYSHAFAEDATDLDSKFFYSVPTSFFVLDPAIPRVVRDIFTEAEGCLKGNFLTGASACARKVVFELARDRGAKGDDYEARIKSLKAIQTDIDPAYFDTLLTIHQLTSNKVHDDAFDGWEAKHLRLILATLKEVVSEIYVIPGNARRRKPSWSSRRMCSPRKKRNRTLWQANLGRLPNNSMEPTRPAECLALAIVVLAGRAYSSRGR
jgi:hypothetical protein